MPRTRKKRRAAWASITTLEEGQRYRIRFWGKGPDGEYRRRSETVRGSRLDAEKRRAELMLDHSDDAPCPTVRQAWEKWALPTYRRRVESGDMSPATLGQYVSAWSVSVGPRWADVQLDAVRPLHVQQWIDGLTYSQAQKATVVLKGIMDYGVRYEVVDHNPMRERYLMPSQSTIERRDPGIWTVAQLAELARSVRGQWYEPATLLAGFGGMRVGESLGVLAGEVERRNVGGIAVATVPVTRQVPNKGAESVDRLKNGQSERVAALVGPPAERLLQIVASLPPDWPLTHDGMGGWQPQRRLAGSWDGGHPFRNLRNSFETWMRYDLRAPRWLIERLMGHAAGDVSDAYYDRPDAQRIAEMLADLYRDRPIFGTIWDA